MEISPNAIDKKNITETDKGNVSNCTSPRGHCYGGLGGEFRVQKLSDDKTKMEEDTVYLKCQWCGKYSYQQTYEEKTKNPEQ